MHHMNLNFIGSYSFDTADLYSGSMDKIEEIIKSEITTHSKDDKLKVERAISDLNHHCLLPFSYNLFLGFENHSVQEKVFRTALNKSRFLDKASGTTVYVYNNTDKKVTVIDTHQNPYPVEPIREVAWLCDVNTTGMEMPHAVYFFFTRRYEILFNRDDELEDEMADVEQALEQIRKICNDVKSVYRNTVNYCLLKQYKKYLERHGESLLPDKFIPDVKRKKTVIHVGVIGMVDNLTVDRYGDIYIPNVLLTLTNKVSENKHIPPIQNPTSDFVEIGRNYSATKENSQIVLYDSKGVFNRLYYISVNRVLEVTASENSGNFDDGVYIYNTNDSTVDFIPVDDLLNDIENNRSEKYMLFASRHAAEEFRDVAKRTEAIKSNLGLETKKVDLAKTVIDHKEKRKTEKLLAKIKKQNEKEAALYRKKIEEFKIENERIRNEQERIKKEYEVKKAEISETVETIKTVGIVATAVVTLYLAYAKLRDS